MGMQDTKPLVPLARLSKENPFLIVALIDSSSSMASRQDETIDGFNGFLDQQQKITTPTIMHVAIFNNRVIHVHQNTPIEQVRHITRQDYRPSGGTALLDAVGSSLDAVTAQYPGQRRGVFMIITDGEEYDSRNYDWDGVKARMDRAKDNGWDFVFLGEGPNAWKTGQRLNVHSQADWGAGGMAHAYATITRNLVVMRSKDITSKGVTWDGSPLPEEGYQTSTGRRFKRA